MPAVPHSHTPPRRSQGGKAAAPPVGAPPDWARWQETEVAAHQRTYMAPAPKDPKEKSKVPLYRRVDALEKEAADIRSQFVMLREATEARVNMLANVTLGPELAKEPPPPPVAAQPAAGSTAALAPKVERAPKTSHGKSSTKKEHQRSAEHRQHHGHKKRRHRSPSLSPSLSSSSPTGTAAPRRLEIPLTAQERQSK